MNSASVPPLILASSSPFRKELLVRLNLPFETAAPDVDESRMENEPAIDLVRRAGDSPFSKLWRTVGPGRWDCVHLLHNAEKQRE